MVYEVIYYLESTCLVQRWIDHVWRWPISFSLAIEVKLVQFGNLTILISELVVEAKPIHCGLAIE